MSVYSTGFGAHIYSVVFRILMMNNTQWSDYGICAACRLLVVD